MAIDDDWARHAARRASTDLVLAHKAIDLKASADRTALQGAYRLSSYRHRFFDISEGGSMKVRSVWISIHYDDRFIGAAEFSEWSIPKGARPSTFWYWADGLSIEDSRLAEVLGSFWPRQAWPPLFGNVVTFHRLAVDTRRDGGRTALRQLGAYLAVEFRRRASVIVLQAFPLEFEGELPHGSGRKPLFNRRVAAMLRLYQSSLGACPFADQASYPGWMWLALRDIPPPTRKANAKWLARIR